nr:DUF4878 domain-containing protein [uncultured Capnocytophaga sp.]
MRYYIGGFVLTLLGFMSCSQPNKNTPEAAVEGFITAIEQKEFDKAKQYGDSTVLVQMNQIQAMLSQQGNDTLSPSKKLDFQIIEVTPIGEDAVMVTYSIATGNSYKQLRVNKINGDWKVTLQSDRNQN